jgi:hypothetical protein
MFPTEALHEKAIDELKPVLRLVPMCAIDRKRIQYFDKPLPPGSEFKGRLHDTVFRAA